MEPEPEPVTLLVKSPNQRHRDLELSADRSWSVGRLKAHLSRVYPERPERASRQDEIVKLCLLIWRAAIHGVAKSRTRLSN